MPHDVLASFLHLPSLMHELHQRYIRPLRHTINPISKYSNYNWMSSDPSCTLSLIHSFFRLLRHDDVPCVCQLRLRLVQVLLELRPQSPSLMTICLLILDESKIAAFRFSSSRRFRPAIPKKVLRVRAIIALRIARCFDQVMFVHRGVPWTPKNLTCALWRLIDCFERRGVAEAGARAD